MKKYIFILVASVIGLSWLIFYHMKLIISRSKNNNALCPKKVVSLMVGLDEITYYVARNKLIGVSYLSFDPKISNIANKLHNIKPMKVEIEGILKLKPDVVFFSSFSNTNLVNVVVQNGVKVELFKSFNSLNDIEDNIKRVASLTCQPVNGIKLLKWVKGITNRLKKKCAKIKRKYSAIYISLNLLSAGKNTIVSDILELACFNNVVKDAGIKNFIGLKLEDILRYNPDVIIFDEWTNINSFFARFSSLKKLKAYQQGSIVQIESKLLMAVSQYSFLSAWILFNKIYQSHK